MCRYGDCDSDAMWWRLRQLDAARVAYAVPIWLLPSQWNLHAMRRWCEESLCSAAFLTPESLQANSRTSTICTILAALRARPVVSSPTKGRASAWPAQPASSKPTRRHDAASCPVLTLFRAANFVHQLHGWSLQCGCCCIHVLAGRCPLSNLPCSLLDAAVRAWYLRCAAWRHSVPRVQSWRIHRTQAFEFFVR